MNVHDPDPDCRCKPCCIDRAAQSYVDAIAQRDSMSPEDAARAALPIGTPEQLIALTERIRAMREPLTPVSHRLRSTG
jgi:hypothetical protein